MSSSPAFETSTSSASTTEDTFLAKREAIHAEQDRLRQELEVRHDEGDLAWCSAQVVDLLAAWDAADGEVRSRLLASLFDRLEATINPDGRLRVLAVPGQGGWRSFGPW